MRISVIVPTLNEAARIESCLAAAALAFPGAEIIVSDGASEDETAGFAQHSAERCTSMPVHSRCSGGVTERTNVTVSKTVGPFGVPRVQIPPPPRYERHPSGCLSSYRVSRYRVSGSPLSHGPGADHSGQLTVWSCGARERV